MFGSFFGRRNRRIRSYLNTLVLSCLVPVCLASAYLLHSSYENRVALLEQNLAATADILSVAVDRDLAIIRASLEALATSPALAASDMSAFYDQVRNVLLNFPDADVILADASGQQLVNSYKPYGSPLPKRNPQGAVRRIFETGWPSISNVFRGAVTGRYLIGVDVPVFEDGQVRYDLAMTLPADRLNALLHPPALPKEWLVSILDRNNVIAARSSLPETYVGKPVESQPLLRMMAADEEGATDGVNAEGVPVTVSFKRSAMTGWTVLVSVPRAVMAAELWRWLKWVVAALCLLILFGLSLAMDITRIITRSVQRLIEPALALGRGEPLSLGRFELKETHEVANALLRAETLLREHEAEEEKLRKGEEAAMARADAAEELAAIVECSDDAILSKTLDGIITSWNSAAEKIYGYTAEEAIGRPVSILVPSDKWDEIRDILRKISNSERVSNFDTIRLRKNGERIPVSIAVSAIKNEAGEVVGVSTIARDITERKRSEQEREKLLAELRDALANVKTLSGLLPICSYCKKIRNDEGYWQQLEAYIHQRSEAQFSHGICPDCYARVKAELDKEDLSVFKK